MVAETGTQHTQYGLKSLSNDSLYRRTKAFSAGSKMNAAVNNIWIY